MSTLPVITVDAPKCCHDGICINDCPMSLLEMKNNLPAFKDGAEKDCVQCGHCMAVCPKGALSLNHILPGDCPPVQKKISHEETFQLLAGRRSIRRYQDKKVDKKDIKHLLDLVHTAPTAKNTQLVQWIIFNSAEEVRMIAGLTIDLFKTMIQNRHPLAAAYHFENHVNAWEKGQDAVLRGAPALVIAHTPTAYGMGGVDSTIALTYMDLAAPTLGLGCCWAGILMLGISQSAELAGKLHIPENHTCRGALMLGYPKYKYLRIPPRRQPQIVWA